MTVVPGSVSIDSFTVGSLDLTDSTQVLINHINIYEDITLPVFMADAEILDISDALGRYMINGKETVTLALSVPGIVQTINLTLSLLQNKDLDDKTQDEHGTLKYKTYQLRMVSTDMLMNQAYKLAQSYNDQTSNIVQQALQTITTANVNTPDPTTAPQRIIANNEYVYDFLKNLQERHVSSQFQSSLYTLFANRMDGTDSRTFCTFEYLMSQGSVTNFVQDNTMGGNTLTNNNAMANMLWVRIPDSFSTPIVWNSPSIKQVYNYLTGTSANTLVQATASGIILGNSITQSIIQQPNQSQTPQMRGNTVHPDNDTVAPGIADAKVARANYMKDLTQNSVQFEVNGNPGISVGHVVNLTIPKKAWTEWAEGENQINDNVLITKLRHKINPAGVTPQYTTIVEAIKAAYYQAGA